MGEGRLLLCARAGTPGVLWAGPGLAWYPGCSVSTVVCVLRRSVVSDSLQPHGLQPSRLLCSQGYPCKNTEVGCHFLLLENLSHPGIEAASPASPALAAEFFSTEPTEKA